MVVVNRTENFKIRKSKVALGKFDGVHLGHQKILEELKADREEGIKTVVITFSVSPESVLSHRNLKYIMTDSEKQTYFESCGIDYLIDIPLDEAFLNVEAEDFVRAYLKEKLGAVKIVCGQDFRFGKGRKGDVSLLRRMGDEYGFETKLVSHVMVEGREISSTRIREEILKGNIRQANRMLGHDYAISGVVQHGKQLGRTIEFPTVNLIPPEDKILPPNGVYAVWVDFGNQRKRGITNIGVRPTVGEKESLSVETNILDFAGDLYGEKITVSLKEFVRAEKKFASLEELKGQIKKDIIEGFKKVTETC